MVHRPERVILTIARQMAAGGSYIGYTLASKLQLAYMNREILRRAAGTLCVDDPGTLEWLDERRGTFWTRLTRWIALGAPEAPFVPAPLKCDEDDLFDVESNIIAAIAEHEDAVIVGHGAGFILRNHPGVIRVFVHAPEPWRIAVAQRTFALEPNAARDLVRQSDRRRARFIEGLSGVAWTDARLYDLAVDTSALETATIIDWLAEVVRARLQGRHAVVPTDS
jgi:cytidylate kinase